MNNNNGDNNFKNIIAFLLPLILGLLFTWMAISSFEKKESARLATPLPTLYVPTQTVATVSVAETPQMIVLNAATAEAIRPPTQTPTTAPTYIPESFAPGGEYDATINLWLVRGLGLCAVIFLFVLVYIYREIKIYELELDHEEKLAEITAMEKLKVNPRPIMSAKKIDTEDGAYTKLSTGTAVSQILVKDFLTTVLYEDDSLAVSRWKAKPGWTQVDIESILDHLASAGMVTKRQNGKACEWLTELDRRKLAHVFRLSAFEIRDPNELE